ncbi:MAG: hypothetical protein M1838_003671, partial [Thelocarpon superellum]
ATTHGIGSYQLRREAIIEDLTERPEWLLSAYGPGRNAPIQLFGGPSREQSFEEMRLHHYHAASAGQVQQVVDQAQRLVSQAEQQIQAALADVDGAINYVLEGAKTHPNRIDVCAGASASVQGGNAPAAISGQPPAFALGSGAFGKPSNLNVPGTAFGQTTAQAPATSAFGQPSQLGGGSSAFGKPSQLGAGVTGFGQPSQLGAPTTGFGQPSQLGGNLAAGQPPLRGPSAGVFGGSAAHGASGAFGQPTTLTPSGGFGKPSDVPHAGVFGRPSAPPSNPFAASSATAQAPAPGTFGQPSPLTRPNPFAVPANQATTGSDAFATPQAPTSNPFGPANVARTDGNDAGSGGIFAKPAVVPNGTAPQQGGSDPSGYSTRDASNRLLSWKSRRVQYIDGEPCYQGGDGKWERIWFPDGSPPTIENDTHLPMENYDDKTKDAYLYVRDHGVFKDGWMPLLPPRREWCRWDF